MKKKAIIISTMVFFCLICLALKSHALQLPQKNMKKVIPQPSYGKIPLHFIENKGQVDTSVAYYLKGKSGTVYFTKEAIVYDLFSPKESHSVEKGLPSPLSDHRVRPLDRLSFSLKPIGANKNLRLIANKLLPGKLNYLMGNDPEKIRDGFNDVLNGRWPKGEPIPLWDGRASERIADLLVALVSDL